MKKIISFIFLTGIFYGCSSSDPATTAQPDTFYKGMDLSFQPELSGYGVLYRNVTGNPEPLLDQVQASGANVVRLKLWHTPDGGLNGLNAVKAYALELKQHGLSLLLDIHYSDTWADPAHQTPPAAWQGQTVEALRESVYQYTKTVVTALESQGTPPAFVQIGNETDSGFLWDYGKVWDDFDDNWGNLAAIIGKAAQAIREASPSAKIILHHSSVENARYYFEELQPYAIDFDVIGLSYYPQFQTKNLTTVQNSLNFLAQHFGKDVMIVETAYPFTFGYDDNLTNYIGDATQIIPAYPATPAGQKAFLDKLTEILKNVPDGKGIGWVYWAPDWVAFPGNEATSTTGSAWENQALWDFGHSALPALEAFKP